MISDFQNDFMFKGSISLFMIVFCLILFLFVLSLGYNVFRWLKNNNSPKIVANAKIVSKRTKYTHNHHDDLSTGYSRYFVTFEFESKDRLELKVDSREYGLLAEGDIGKLTFQGTRYLSFERE